MLSSADVLLAVLEPEAGIFSVPSKILTYHCTRKPLLLSVPENNLSSKIVKKNKTGIAVDSNKDVEFINSAEILYNDDLMRENYGRNAREYAEKNFDIIEIRRKFEKILDGRN